MREPVYRRPGFALAVCLASELLFAAALHTCTRRPPGLLPRSEGQPPHRGGRLVLDAHGLVADLREGGPPQVDGAALRVAIGDDEGLTPELRAPLAELPEHVGPVVTRERRLLLGEIPLQADPTTDAGRAGRAGGVEGDNEGGKTRSSAWYRWLNEPRPPQRHENPTEAEPRRSPGSTE